jgi:hypothetical protein
MPGHVPRTGGGPADPVPPGDAGRRLARVATEVFAPGVLIVVVVVCAAWRGAAGAVDGWIAAVVGVATGSLIPLAYIARGVRRGRWTDRHVGVLGDRRWPLAVALLSGTAGTVALALVGADEVVAVGAAGMAALVATMVVTLGLNWKISVHAVCAAGVVAMLTVMFFPWPVLAWPLPVLISWSRVRLGDHTVGQVVTGTALGALVMAPVYALLS